MQQTELRAFHRPDTGQENPMSCNPSLFAF